MTPVSGPRHRHRYKRAELLRITKVGYCYTIATRLPKAAMRERAKSERYRSFTRLSTFLIKYPTENEQHGLERGAVSNDRSLEYKVLYG